ncbi:MAG: hypothetical protein ACLT0Y_02325 [Christensenellales bacterium]
MWPGGTEKPKAPPGETLPPPKHGQLLRAARPPVPEQFDELKNQWRRGQISSQRGLQLHISHQTFLRWVKAMILRIAIWQIRGETVNNLIFHELALVIG